MACVSNNGVASCDMIRCPSSQCKLGAKLCKNDATLHECQKDPQSPLECTKFVEKACEVGSYCVHSPNMQNASCQSECTVECTNPGHVQCEDGGTQVSECVDIDGMTADGASCTMKKLRACGSDMGCNDKTHQCDLHECTDANVSFCADDMVVTCELNSGVRRKVVRRDCKVEGMICQGDKCVCNNPCTEGDSRCSLGTQGDIETCKKDPNSGCMHWEVSTTCTGASMCSMSREGPMCTCSTHCAKGDIQGCNGKRSYQSCESDPQGSSCNIWVDNICTQQMHLSCQNGVSYQCTSNKICESKACSFTCAMPCL